MSNKCFLQRIRSIKSSITKGSIENQSVDRRYEVIIQEQLEQLKLKDKRIEYLTSELDKYQSILNKSSTISNTSWRDVDANFETIGLRERGIGISGETQLMQTVINKEIKQYLKTKETRSIIKQAIINNDFLKYLDNDQITEVVNSMYPANVQKDKTIIKEGERGTVLYVMEDGIVGVYKDCKKVNEISFSTCFGELAILYNCLRTATVTALSDCSLWAIDRNTFHAIMMKTGLMKQQKNLELLKSVPIFKSLSSETLAKFVDLLEEAHFDKGTYIIRQGAHGNTFYIIASGEVQVTQNRSMLESYTESKEKFIRVLNRGEWFGERALKNEELRTANIIASSPEGVDCLILDRESYELYLGDIESLKRRYTSERREEISLEKADDAKFNSLTLRDLCVISTLGVGGFGRVELVRIGEDNARTFALKRMKKHFIVETKQEAHVMSEKNILFETECEFIVRLYRTFKDRKYLYMMMEVCLGGELWTVLRNQKSFCERTTRFFVSCVVEAMVYLHSRGIVYRDLKPENLLLDSQGYCKMTDFGFAKKIGFGNKTWTFCGTPEYVAPEIILNRGHDFSADAWSLGILMFELHNGNPPFTSNDSMKTYNIILKGMDAIEFPNKMPKNMRSLIKRLCRGNPTERLGYGKGGLRDIKKHVWFEGYDWEGLRFRKLIPPYIPKVQSAIDMSNFDHYKPDVTDPPEDVSGWDIDF